MDINSTKEVKAGSVLGSTLNDMKEFDVNKLNDADRGKKK